MRREPKSPKQRTSTPTRRAAHASRFASSFLAAVTIAGAMLLQGCIQERVIYNHPMLGGLPGSSSNMPITAPPGMKAVSQEEVANTPIKVDNPDGSVTLRARTVRHLMIHIHNLLDDKPVAKGLAPELKPEEPGDEVNVAAKPKPGDRPGRPEFETKSAAAPGVQTNEEIFAEQVLSKATKDEFAERGMPPAEAYKWCREARDDIEDLFAQMPMGENSAGVYFEKLGDRVYRVRVSPQAAKALRFSGMDVVMERGNYKLRWFVEK